jgi:hypothetical protein
MTVRFTLAPVLLTAAVAVLVAPVARAAPAIDAGTAAGHNRVRLEQKLPRVTDPVTRRWAEYQQAVSARAASAPGGVPSVSKQGGLSPFVIWLIVAGGLFAALSLVQFVARATGHGLHRRHA